jgi:hypothetical protein
LLAVNVVSYCSPVTNLYFAEVGTRARVRAGSLAGEAEELGS